MTENNDKNLIQTRVSDEIKAKVDEYRKDRELSEAAALRLILIKFFKGETDNQ